MSAPAVRRLLPAALLGLTAGLPLLLAQPPQARRYAVLVGIKEYDHIKLRPLDYSETDVNDLAEVLRGGGYEVTLLTTTARDAKLRPTLANINDRLGEVLEKGKRNDTVLVGLSGHGLQFDGQRDAFFCPQDANPSRPETLLSLAGLYNRLDGSGAGVKLLLVDACRDDPKGKGSKGVNAGNSPRPPAGVAALFSCSAGEQSFESDKIKHGVFFYYVLEGLKGKARNDDREVTWDGLQQYVRRRVSRDVGGLIGGEVRQTPALSAGELAGEPPVLLVVNGGAGQPRPEGGAVEVGVGAVPGPRPRPLDCTGADGVKAADVGLAQKAWAEYLGRKVEETVEVANGVKMTFVLVPPGKFRMGSPADEKERLDDETLHEVTLTEPFDLGKTEVTQAQYQGLGGKNPSQSAKGPDLPVENVKWEEARDYAAQLTKKRGDHSVYRLPTEAEWEYACRGGRPPSQPFGVGDGQALSARQANFNDTGRLFVPQAATRRVGSYAANALGLSDMHGNVGEWCADWYGPYPQDEVTNPAGPLEGAFLRVFRGGGWFDGPGRCRAAARLKTPPNMSNRFLGFRLARSVPSGGK